LRRFTFDTNLTDNDAMREAGAKTRAPHPRETGMPSRLRTSDSDATPSINRSVGASAPLSRSAMAYVLAGGRGSRLMELTDRRAKPAVYFGGKARIIDFALSNALNSGIRRIGVATQYKAHSLIRHLQRGWTFFREARAYQRSVGVKVGEEKMAVIVQEIVGARHDDRYYPHISGVARS
jgi:hypothetical protein